MEYLLGDKGNLIGLNPTLTDWGTWDQGFYDPVGGGALPELHGAALWAPLCLPTHPSLAYCPTILVFMNRDIGFPPSIPCVLV